MAFTTVSRIRPGGEGSVEPGYFHQKDIDILMSQPGAEAVAPFNAFVQLPGQAPIPCTVLLAVADIDPDPRSKMFRKVLNGVSNFAALLCPPIRDDGAVLRTDFLEVNIPPVPLPG